MNIDLELYRIFYVVAKSKNMTRAGEELFISQPAISQAIKKLETELGGTLFLRSNKGMELTEEGKMFYSYIKDALELINNAEAEFTSFKDLDKGEVKIGISTTLTKLVLMDTIKEFHKNYPNIDIKITNELTSNLIENLKRGKLDFVIYNESDIKEIGIELKVIKKLKEGFIYNPYFYKDDIKSIKDIINYPLILQKNESNSRKRLDNYCLSNGIILKPKMEVVSQDLILEFTNAGLGIGYTLVDLTKIKYPELKELSINKEIPRVDIILATNKGINLTFAAKKFLNNLNSDLY
jgi:DNA-binding transcriptional LysR family regulator